MICKITTLFPDQVSVANKSRLQMEVTEEEIQSTLFFLKNDKARGLDGFTMLFFKEAKCIVMSAMYR